MNNVYLIGLSGSGKSTLARMLAGRIGRDWLDTDAEIEKAAGMSIAEIFSLHGEPRFRELETEAVLAACRRSDIVVATGGGAVLCEENVNAMRKSGVVVWLNRPIDSILSDLDTSARPLARNAAAFLRMAEQRTPIYAANCDIEFSNVGTAQEAVNSLSNLLLKIL